MILPSKFHWKLKRISLGHVMPYFSQMGRVMQCHWKIWKPVSSCKRLTMSSGIFGQVIANQICALKNRTNFCNLKREAPQALISVITLKARETQGSRCPAWDDSFCNLIMKPLYFTIVQCYSVFQIYCFSYTTTFFLKRLQTKIKLYVEIYPQA